LLEDLDTNGQNETAAVLRLVVLEELGPADGSLGVFELQGADDVVPTGDDVRVRGVGVDALDGGEDGDGFVETVVGDQPAGRFREEDELGGLLAAGNRAGDNGKGRTMVPLMAAKIICRETGSRHATAPGA
jgi:hypothetical protein